MKYRPDITDGIALVGLLLLAGGLAVVYWPLSLIIPGAILLIVGLAAGARRGGGSD